MKSRMSRTLCAVLALALALTMLPVKAKAANESKKLIALTFDDGPSANTAGLLDELEKRGVVATFFMNGHNGGNGVGTYASLVPRMFALGCQPANHSDRHAKFSTLSAQQMASEVSAVSGVLYNAAGGSYTDLVRIPYGQNTSAIRSAVSHPLILWSIDPEDWKDRNSDIVYNRIVNKAYDGAIILLHDLYPTSVSAGLRAIDTLRQQGYEFVTVSELFRRRGIDLQNGTSYTAAPNRGTTLPAYAAPEIEVDETKGVVLRTGDSGLTLRYTTDGTVPTLASPAYTAPIPLDRSMDLCVAGFDRFATRTPVARRTVVPRTAAVGVERFENGLLSLICPDKEAAIVYTTDGSDPAVSGLPYTGPFTPGRETRAVARSDGRLPSAETVLTLTSGGELFLDVPTDAWYYAVVDQIVSSGVMNGVGSWRFDPQASMTRAALVSVLCRISGDYAPPWQTGFEDVESGSWYEPAVGWAVREEIVNGVSENRFDPNGVLTREQAAVVLARYAANEGLDMRCAPAAGAEEASPYAREALSWCVAYGVLKGDEAGRLNPAEPMTRAQCASMLSAFLRLL